MNAEEHVAQHGVAPLDDRLVLKPEIAETQSVGGLHVYSEMRPITARVVAVGPGRYYPKLKVRCAPQVKPGDRVVVERAQVLEFRLDGRLYWTIAEAHVIAVVDDGVTVTVDKPVIPGQE